MFAAYIRSYIPLQCAGTSAMTWKIELDTILAVFSLIYRYDCATTGLGSQGPELVAEHLDTTPCCGTKTKKTLKRVLSPCDFVVP